MDKTIWECALYVGYHELCNAKLLGLNKNKNMHNEIITIIIASFRKHRNEYIKKSLL